MLIRKIFFHKYTCYVCWDRSIHSVLWEKVNFPLPCTSNDDLCLFLNRKFSLSSFHVDKFKWETKGWLFSLSRNLFWLSLVNYELVSCCDLVSFIHILSLFKIVCVAFWIWLILICGVFYVPLRAVHSGMHDSNNRHHLHHEKEKRNRREDIWDDAKSKDEESRTGLVHGRKSGGENYYSRTFLILLLNLLTNISLSRDARWWKRDWKGGWVRNG